MGKSNFFRCILILSALILSSTNTFAGMCLYDNFTGTYINSEKWTDLEFVRTVEDGGFVSKIRSSDDSAGKVRNKANTSNFNTCTSLQADIKAVDINLDSTNESWGEVYLQGAFYNTDFAAPSDATGDIAAIIIIGDWGDGLKAQWYIIKFLDGTWTNSTILERGVLVSPGNLSLKAFYTTKITYNGDTEFKYSIDGFPEVTANGPAKKGEAFLCYKQFQTAAYCEVPSSAVFVSAIFDNFYVNGALYDDFSGTKIDPEKWNRDSLDAVREIRNEKLQMDVQGYNQFSKIDESLKNSTASCIKAKTSVGSATALSAGAEARTFVGGTFYNDTYGPGNYNQLEGEVYVVSALSVDENEQLQAVARALRSSDASGSNWVEIFPTHTFSMLVLFDTGYNLSVELNGSELIFKCDDETFRFDITTSVNQPYRSTRTLSSRMWLDSGESGYVKATFDDVYVCCEGIPVFVSKDDNTCGGNSPCYTSIQGAIAGTGTDDIVINVSEGEYSEAPTVNQSRTVTIKGGLQKKCKKPDV